MDRQEGHLRIGVVGLNFGREFVPIYQDHPAVSEVGIVDLNEDLLNAVGEEFAVRARFASVEAFLESDEWDAVHLVTPSPLHAEQAIACMRAGMHVACAVPAGASFEELVELVAVQQETKRNYMMMETAIYSAEFLYVKAMYDEGSLGRVQLLRGAHYQDMDGWPSYWEGLPPMHYSTHAVGPLMHLLDARASSVSCAGSGTMSPERRKMYSNPFPIETAHIRLEGPKADGVVAEVTRSLFETAIAFEESFSVYGDKASFFWGNPLTGGRHTYLRLRDLQSGEWGRWMDWEHPSIPFRPDLLPAEISRFAENLHGGAEPHLVNEFVRSILEGRAPEIDVRRAAEWTAVGLVAHESAINGGVRIDVPCFADASPPSA